MIILNNRGIYGTGVVVYDIHRDTENEVPVGVISYLIEGDSTGVLIRLYDDELVNGSTWPLGVHHYQSEIIDVLKLAEPNLKPIIEIEITKFKK